MKVNNCRLRAAAWCAALCASAAPAARADWTHLAGDAARRATAPHAPAEFDRTAWERGAAIDEEFVGRGSPVASDGRVFVNLRTYPDNLPGPNALLALDAASGEELWRRPLAADALESIASPCVYARGGVVLIGLDRSVFALRVGDGAIAWSCELARSVVNASVAVSEDLLDDAVPANRAFITDYSPFGTGALYAINLDPFHSAGNPYAPGEIVWSAPLTRTSGNSPAYSGGDVFVATAGGRVACFDARSGQPRWQSAPQPDGFFGGVCVSGGAVFAATYNFYGGHNNSRLVKLDANSGEVIWTTPCERSASIPVVAGGGRIYLSGGIEGFGSLNKVQAFLDEGATARLLWDSAADGGGMLTIGGWQHQPALADGLLYSGVLNSGDLASPYERLVAVDTRRRPEHPQFVRAERLGVGGPPAIALGRVYSIGEDGVVALRDRRLGDLNCDDFVDNGDIDAFVLLLIDPAAYVAAHPECSTWRGDVNGDGVTDNGDLDAFIARLLGEN